MTNKETKRKRLEEIVKRVFNVFCYVVTVLAITLGIAVGVTKCSGSAATETIAADPTESSTPSDSTVIRKRAGNPNLDELAIFVSRYTGEHIIDFDDLRSYFNVSESFSASARSSILVEYRIDGYFWADDSYYNLSRLTFRWDDLPVQAGTPQYLYKLGSVYFRSIDGTYSNIYGRINDYSGGDDTGQFYNTKIVLSNDSQYTERVPFLAFFEEVEKSYFTFNEGFNYNAPFNANVNAVFGYTSFDGGGQNISWKDYSVGWFYSNGRLFNTIRWYAQSLARGGALLIDGQVTSVVREDMYFYTNMYYRNSETSEEIMVNFREHLPYNGGDNVYYSNSTTWVVPAYREIVLLSELSDSMRDILEAFNNSNQSTYGGGMVSGEVNDIFSLIAGAFTAWVPVLGMYILPNITIGTLLFVPLVALLVFAIIRIIKK